MGKILEISPTTWHEGHSKLVLQVDEQGIERGDWVSITPVRGIEKLVIRKTMEKVPKIASRACGICPVSLPPLAATEAMEASIDCPVPEDAHILRVIMFCANRLHNVALHNILILPDFTPPGTDTKINPFSPEEPTRTVTHRIQRLRMIGQTIAEIAGGEAVHPSNPRIGGMYTNVSRQAKMRMEALAKEAMPLAVQQTEFMIAVIRNYQKRDWVDVGGKKIALLRTLGDHSLRYLATTPVYGTTSRADNPGFDPLRCIEVHPWSLYMGGVKVDLADPGYPIGGTNPSGRLQTHGSNVHFARVKDGKVLSYAMNVPTQWNIPVACAAPAGAPWQLAEVVIRGYDPCFSCATHMIVVEDPCCVSQPAAFNRGVFHTPCVVGNTLKWVAGYDTLDNCLKGSHIRERFRKLADCPGS